MRIWVITPVYWPKKEWLDQCLQSVKSQTVGAVRHLLVVDGTGYEPPAGVEVIQLEKNHNDFGDTPRHVGIQHARSEGADVIALLDDDNWYEPDHLETAIAVQQQTGAAFIGTRRSMIHLETGATLGVCGECGTGRFADTSAMVYFPASFPHLSKWGEVEEHALDDRIVWTYLRKHAGEPALTGKPTLNYRCTHAFHYQQFGIPTPPDTKTDTRVDEALARMKAAGRDDLFIEHSLVSA